MKLLDKLLADPRVKEIDDERSYGNGWFVYLRAGYAYGGTGEAHCFSEDTLTDVKRSLGVVARCECADCKEALAAKKELW